MRLLHRMRDQGNELVIVLAFTDIIISTKPHRLHDIGYPGMRGEKNDLDGHASGLYMLGEFQSIPIRQLYITNHYIDILAENAPRRRPDIRRLVHSIALQR